MDEPLTMSFAVVADSYGLPGAVLTTLDITLTAGVTQTYDLGFQNLSLLDDQTYWLIATSPNIEYANGSATRPHPGARPRPRARGASRAVRCGLLPPNPGSRFLPACRPPISNRPAARGRSPATRRVSPLPPVQANQPRARSLRTAAAATAAHRRAVLAREEAPPKPAQRHRHDRHRRAREDALDPRAGTGRSRPCR